MTKIEKNLWGLAWQNLIALEKEIDSSIWTEKATQQKDIIAFHSQLSQQKCLQEQDTIENQIAVCLLNNNGRIALEHLENLLLEKKNRKLENIFKLVKRR